MIYIIKHFVFGEPRTAVIKADSQERAIYILERESGINVNLDIRDIERIDIIEGIIDAYFE